MKIALLEDEPALAQHLLSILRDAGHDCKHKDTGSEFLRMVQRESFDLLILDWQIPDGDGLSVMRDVRKEVEWPIPILFLTQRDDEADIVTALQAGADDYMVKPARRGELLARITALSRRHQHHHSEEDVLQFGDFLLDRRQRSIKVKGESVNLTDKDFDLTLFLFENLGRLLSRGYLLERVWGLRQDLNTRTVDTHISRLRRKIGIKPENGYRIRTIYQHGYRLESVEAEAET